MKTNILAINPKAPESDKIAKCAQFVRDGGLVIFPTETVYGIAANYEDPRAMKRLIELKNRSKNNPFSILVSKKDDVDFFVRDCEQYVYKVIDTFWPGPLTAIIGSGEGKTIGLRMPDNAIALNLVREARCIVVAPSANLKGKKPPVTCQEALKDLDGLVDAAIDGGPSSVGKESSVVDMTNSDCRLIREGAITQEQINKAVKTKNILFVCTGNSCRSVMAEFLFKKMTQDRGDIEVISAGTGTLGGNMASTETVAVLEKEGIDVSWHRARALTKTMIKKADLIFVMTQTHRNSMENFVPSAGQRIYLLKEFCRAPKGKESDLDIPDPIGQSRQTYEECLLVIKEALTKILDMI